MSRNIIRVANPELQTNTQTQLSSELASWVTTLYVQSTSWIKPATWEPAQFNVIIGRYWEEKSEIVLVSAVPGNNTLTCSATKYSHSASDMVTLLPYDKIKFYWGMSPTSINNLIDTLDIDPSSQSTKAEYGGGVYSYFAFSYYNSYLLEESDKSDYINSNIFTNNSVKKIIESWVRKALTRIDNNPNAVLTTDVLIDMVNEGLGEIIMKKRKWQFLHKINATLTTTTWVSYIEKPEDLSVLEFIIVNWRKIDYISKMKYDQYTSYWTVLPLGTPTNYTLKNWAIYLFPVPNESVPVIVEYYKKPETVTSLTDKVDSEFAVMLTYYIWAQAAFARNNEKTAKDNYAIFNSLLQNQIEEYTGAEQVGDWEYAEQTSIYWFEDENLIM